MVGTEGVGIGRMGWALGGLLATGWAVGRGRTGSVFGRALGTGVGLLTLGADAGTGAKAGVLRLGALWFSSSVFIGLILITEAADGDVTDPPELVDEEMATLLLRTYGIAGWPMIGRCFLLVAPPLTRGSGGVTRLGWVSLGGEVTVVVTFGELGLTTEGVMVITGLGPPIVADGLKGFVGDTTSVGWAWAISAENGFPGEGAGAGVSLFFRKGFLEDGCGAGAMFTVFILG